MMLLKLKQMVLFFCLKIAGGEHDFNFSEELQRCCFDALYSTELSVRYETRKDSFHDQAENNFDNRLQLHKRETEGSGEEDYDQYDYDDDITESVTEIPSFTTHAHRHHHGTDKKEEMLTEKKNVEKNVISNDKILKKDLPDFSKMEEDIVKSVSKLESDITKTIENTKNIKDSTIELNLGKDKSNNLSSIISGSQINKIDDYDESRNRNTSSDKLQVKNGKVTEDISFSTLKNIPTSHATHELTSEKHHVITSFTPSQKTIFEKKGSFENTNKLLLINSDEVETNTLNSVIMHGTGTTMPAEITNLQIIFTLPSLSTTDISLTINEILENQTQSVLNSAVFKNELSTKKEYENNVTVILNTTIISNTDQQEPTEATLRGELEASTLMPTSTELYLTSEDVEVDYITNNTQNASTKVESSTVLPTTFSSIEIEESKLNNTPPVIKARLKKYTSVSGKLFRYVVPLETFYDNENGYDLRLELLDKNEEPLKATSWIHFDADAREIYGLPMEDTVSRWQFKLKASDSGNESVIELVEIFVYQHKGLRSVNHEVNIQLELLDNITNNIDWQIMLVQAIGNILDNNDTSNLVVREILPSQIDPHQYNFTYFNESLPTGSCPLTELDNMIKHLEMTKLSALLSPKLNFKSVSGKLVGACQKEQITNIAKNYPPVPRNQVDRVNATVGHLLIYKVPDDTFYDPNDNSNLKLSLLTMERKEISLRHWLRFDSKNKEFYGIPKSADIGSEELLLVAEDSDGLSATDALVVVVNHAPKRDYSVYFKAYLAIRHDKFNVILQRKFMERLAELFGDDNTDFIQIRSITTHHDSDGTIVNFYNTTLYKMQNSCPDEKIDLVRNVYFVQDLLLRDKVKKLFGVELNLTNMQIIPLGSCHPISDVVHKDTVPTINEQPDSISIFTDDYIFSFLIPAVIMLTMILLAAAIAFFLHRRHITGKMELGDEEERKSFRPKGIPVIFQDELDEKPEIGNKSPIILKDEKPPLLPPSYNQSNFDGVNEVDEYVPPPAVVVGSREIRGKSPATPSYRKPPPYVSP